MFPSTLDSILRGCKEEPFADEPRLVLADWLEEHGQPERADFVRLQLHEVPMERDEWHPDGIVNFARQRRLLRNHISEWTGGTFLDWSWCTFANKAPATLKERDGMILGKYVRGFLEVHTSVEELLEYYDEFIGAVRPWLEKLASIDQAENSQLQRLFRGSFLDPFADVSICAAEVEANDVSAWLNRAPVRSLHFSKEVPGNVLAAVGDIKNLRLHKLGVDITPGAVGNWQRLADSPVLEELIDLEIGDATCNEAVDVLLRSPTLHRLERLALWADELETDRVVAFLRRLRKAPLRELSLTGFTERGKPGAVLAVVRSELPGLERLHLGSSSFDEASVRALAKSPVLASVRVLRMNSCNLNAVSGSALLASEHLSSAHALDLNCNPLGDKPIEVLSHSQQLPALRRLDLCRCELGDKGAKALAKSALLAQITQLDLSMNRFSDRALQEFARSAFRPQDLRLAGLRFGPGFRALIQSPVVHNLTRLTLEQLTPEDIAALADSCALGNLRELCLSGSSIGPAGAQRLAKAPWLRNLHGLIIGENQIGDVGLKAILGALEPGRISQLWITTNNISDAGAQALLDWEGLPDVVELWSHGNHWREELDDRIHAVLRTGIP